MKMIKYFFYPFEIIFVFFVKIYKWFISPLLPHTCKFTPTCSEYMITSLKTFGAVKGLQLGFLRLLKCTPRNKGGFDPVPQNIKGDSRWII